MNDKTLKMIAKAILVALFCWIFWPGEASCETLEPGVEETPALSADQHAIE